MINCFNNVVPKRKQACMENRVDLVKPLSTEVSEKYDRTVSHGGGFL